MSSRLWPDELPVTLLRAYDDVLKLLTELQPQMKGLILSSSFKRYLELSIERGVEVPLSPLHQESIEIERKLMAKSGITVEPLHSEFCVWADAERSSQHVENLTTSGEEVFSQVEPKFSARERLLSQSKEVVLLATTGLSVADLVALSRKGDHESLMRLIRLDKVFLTAALTREWILQAQSREDSAFFGALARALKRDTYREKIDTGNARLGIACYILWFLGFEKLGKRRLMAFVESEDLGSWNYPMTFDRFLSRIGLRGEFGWRTK